VGENRIEGRMAEKAGANGKGRGGTRERTLSVGGIEEVMKRKREDGVEGNRRMMEEIFQRSKKTPRSPGRGESSEGGLEEMMRKWREEVGEVMEEIKGGKGWREEFKQLKEELKEGFREQGRWLREELVALRKDFKEQEKKWEEEREEMRKNIRELNDRMEVLMKEREGERKRVGKGEGKGREELENKVKIMERKLEFKEREERRKNIIIKGVEVKEGKRREAVEEVIGALGMKVDIESCWKLGRGTVVGQEMILVKLKEEKQRKEILEKRRNLRGRRERIIEDWTWEERRMRWKLEEIARKEEEKGKQVWIGYGRIRIEGQWWKWDEVGEILRDGKGRVRREEQGEEGRRGTEDRG